MSLTTIAGRGHRKAHWPSPLLHLPRRHGHTVPSVETLEKMARALEVPLYLLFYEGEEPPRPLDLPKRQNGKDISWGRKGKQAHMLAQFRRLLGRVKEADRRLLLLTAQNMARRVTAKRRVR